MGLAVRTFRRMHEIEWGTTFHFVTDGIDAALEEARRAARGKDVCLGGGANVAQQYLRAGLIDEMEIPVVPLMLGERERLFDATDGMQTRHASVRVVSSPGRGALQVRAPAPGRARWSLRHARVNDRASPGSARRGRGLCSPCRPPRR